MSDTEGTKELEKAIEETRAEVARDIGQVSERLSKEGLVKEVKHATSDMKDRAVDRARGRAREAMDTIETRAKGAVEGVEHAAVTVGRSAKSAGLAVKDELAHNPIAYGLIAAGIGWICFDKIFGYGGLERRRIGTELRGRLSGDGKLERGLVRYADSPVALGATAFVLGTALGVAVPMARRKMDGGARLATDDVGLVH
jgi:hypothetical protein